MILRGRQSMKVSQVTADELGTPVRSLFIEINA
jgi:hypothetical protein